MLLKRKAPANVFGSLHNKVDSTKSIVKQLSRSPIKKIVSHGISKQKKFAASKPKSKTLNAEKSDDKKDKYLATACDKDKSQFNTSILQKSSDTAPDSVDLDETSNDAVGPPQDEGSSACNNYFNDAYLSVMELVSEKTPRSAYNLFFGNRQQKEVGKGKPKANSDTTLKKRGTTSKRGNKTDLSVDEAAASHDYKIPTWVNDDSSQCDSNWLQKQSIDSGSERDLSEEEQDSNCAGVNQTLKERLNLKSTKVYSNSMRETVLDENYQSFLYGTWVECVKCYKWRYLDSVKDPSTLDEDWECKMEGGGKNCSMPQCYLGEVDDYVIFNKYTVGSLVWAKVPGYCWWPAMVDIDPDEDCYFMLEALTDEVADYHVTFLDKDVSRAWVDSKSGIKTFEGSEDMNYMNFNIRNKNYTKQVSQAVENAEKALTLTLEKRLKTFGFLYRYDGKPNVWTQDSKEVPKSMKTKNYMGKGRLPKSKKNADPNEKKRKELENRIKELQKECESLEKISQMSLSQSQIQSSQKSSQSNRQVFTKTKAGLMQQNKKKEHSVKKSEKPLKKKKTLVDSDKTFTRSPKKLKGSGGGNSTREFAKPAELQKVPIHKSTTKTSRNLRNGSSFDSLLNDGISEKNYEQRSEKLLSENSNNSCELSCEEEKSIMNETTRISLPLEEMLENNDDIVELNETTLNETIISEVGTIFPDLYCIPGVNTESEVFVENTSSGTNSKKPRKSTLVKKQLIETISDQESAVSNKSLKNSVSDAKNSSHSSFKNIKSSKRKRVLQSDVESTEESETESLKLMKKKCHEAISGSSSKKNIQHYMKKENPKRLQKDLTLSNKKSRSRNRISNLDNSYNTEDDLSQSSQISVRSTRSSVRLRTEATRNNVINLSQCSTRSSQSKSRGPVQMLIEFSDASGSEGRSKINLPPKAVECSPPQNLQNKRNKFAETKTNNKGMSFKLRSLKNTRREEDSDPMDMEL